MTDARTIALAVPAVLIPSVLIAGLWLWGDMIIPWVIVALAGKFLTGLTRTE